MSLKFIQPESLPEMLDTLTQYGDEAKIMAGGTAVVLMLQQKLIAPEALVSLGRVPNLDYVRSEAAGLHIGPLTLLRNVALSPTVRQQVPALARACAEVGNVRIQNQATLGGNLAEADYASDPPAMLLALDTSVTVLGPAGSRIVPLSDFFLGFYTTVLEPEELIAEIFVPSLPAESRMTYLKYKSRSSEDRPCAGVAAVAAFEQDVCTDLRLAIGAACEVPRRLSEFETLAKGQPLSDELIDEIAQGYAENIETLDDLRGSSWYRTQMVRVHVRRALEEVRHGRR
ncbi:MAG: xanthine dehydrogenase family protein subunit M [Chloroflexi bacterium]|nr:xanthine dehydrogenase family protein subunit M [Chloroflexota bacterium]